MDSKKISRNDLVIMDSKKISHNYQIIIIIISGFHHYAKKQSYQSLLT